MKNQELEEVAELKSQLSKLSIAINETKKRIPAHSIKPPIMMELLDLEDEYDLLMKKLERLQNRVYFES